MMSTTKPSTFQRQIGAPGEVSWLNPMRRSVASIRAWSGPLGGDFRRDHRVIRAAVERDLIIDTLSHCLGNRTHAANILGISIRTLRNKLKQYNEEGFAVPAAHGEDAAASA